MDGHRAHALAFVAASRRAILATRGPDGRARLVPICFTLTPAPDTAGDAGWPAVLHSPLDEKPKSVDDPRRLARVRDVLARPEVTVLVDRWSEDWDRLGWVRLAGRAALLEPPATPSPARPSEHARAVARLREKYPQYGSHALEVAPMLRIVVGDLRAWGDLSID